MRIETAVKQLNKEADFLGLTPTQVLEDIAKYGRMIYSERTVEAYKVYKDYALS